MTHKASLTEGGAILTSIDIRITETAGIPATIASVQTASFDGTAICHQSDNLLDWGLIAWVGAINNAIPANGTISTGLVWESLEPERYCSRFVAYIEYTVDGRQGNLTLSAEGPPLPAPSPDARFTLAGTVSEIPPGIGTTAGLGDVTVEIVDGPDAGRRAVTDHEGKFRLEALTPAVFQVRASKTRYTTRSRGVLLLANRDLTLVLSRQ